LNKGKFTQWHDHLAAILIFSSVANTKISILGHSGLHKQAKYYLLRTILQLHNTHYLSIWQLASS